MVCAGCKTILGWEEDGRSCDFCHRVWCPACAPCEGLETCPECGWVNCWHCLVSDYDPESEDYTGEKILCQNCLETL